MMPPSRRTAALLTLIISLGGAACGSSDDEDAGPTAAIEEPASTQEETAAPSGQETVAGAGFSVALPAGWERFDPGTMSEGDLEAGIERLEIQDPALEQQVRTAIANDLNLFAIDPGSVSTGFADNANVVCVPPPPGAGLDDLEAESASIMEQVGATDLVVTRTELDGQDTVRLSYQLPSVGATAVQFNLLGDDEICTLTVTVGGDDAGRAAAIADPIGATFRVEG